MMIDQNLLSTIVKAQGNKYFLKKMPEFPYSDKSFQQLTFHFVPVGLNIIRGLKTIPPQHVNKNSISNRNGNKPAITPLFIIQV